MSLEERRIAERRGRRAELLCLWMLRLKGWRILERDLKLTVGEIDIIARRGGVLAAIEVKARDDFDAAAYAVSTRQKRRIARALAAFLARRPDLARLSPRFDVMLLVRGRLPRHIAAAWRADEIGGGVG
jgi:putative endonuclease